RGLEAAFLADCGMGPDKDGDLTWTQKEIRRGLRILIEFQETGRFRRHRQRIEEPDIPPVLRQQLWNYESFCKRQLHKRMSTIASHRYVLTRFLAFVGSRGITSFDELQVPVLSGFIAERAHLRPQSLATQWGCIRSFLRFLSTQGLVDPQLAEHVRMWRFSKEQRLPQVWPPEAVAALLEAVDRSTAVGKRQYAILLLASQLGLRASDIRTLKLDDIKWPEARLQVIQSKTGRPLSLPLDEALGQALIDYLRHGRPPSPFREVFLRLRAPYEPVCATNSFHAVVGTALRRADISLPTGTRRGLHGLRHTLATRLVQNGQRFETVAAILGHGSMESTRVYTHLDVNALREVALDPEEVTHG
ncbi:MAG: tyrosine-type recombinase/integrase, partial [Gemmatimonadales bacterium]